MEEEYQNPARQDRFVGIDNRNASVQKGYVRDMENVLSTRDGQRPSRRDGYGIAFHSGSQVHSAWGDGDFPLMLFVDSGTLYGVGSTGDTPDPLVYGLSSGPVSYTRVNQDVYWSNGVQSGMILPDGQVYQWACELPSGQPTLTDAGGGQLDSGSYQVAMTFIDRLGRESGTGLAGVVTISGGGITLSSIPQPSSTDVTSIRIYMTSADGDILHHVLTIPTGIPSASIGQRNATIPLATQFHVPLPAGEVVATAFARLFVARKNVLHWSDALRYGQGNPAQNYVRFANNVTLLAAVADGSEGAGIYIAAGERTYWMTGANPSEWRQVIAYPHGAIAGTLALSPGSVWGLETEAPVPSWLASNGQHCVGLPGGQVVAYNASRATTDLAEYGASMIREVDGQRVMATSLRGPTPSGMTFVERATTQVRRNGVLLP